MHLPIELNMNTFKKNLSILFLNIRNRNWFAVRITLIKTVLKFLHILCLPFGLIFVLVIRLIRPWFLVRFEILVSERIGHFAANTELYLCERDAGINVPQKPYIDLWYSNWPVCNHQLARMWSRVLHIWPAWLLAPAGKINSWIPGGKVHRVGDNTEIDRDVHHLLDRFPPHLEFLPEEEKQGQIGLRILGIPEGAKFICLNVRDSSYLERSLPWKSWDYHSYRNSDIQSYVLAVQKLAELGYYVIRMGVAVKEPLRVLHPRIIDYATSRIRTDFMDIYLGAKCEFCISTSSGFDAIPYVFRRPIVYVNSCPLGYFFTFNQNYFGITKHHFSRKKNRDLTLSEIFSQDVGFCLRTSEYESQGIQLVENSPEEIRDAVIEMVERLNGTWQPHEEDEVLQKHFWEIYGNALDRTGNRNLHGELRSRFGAIFLRNNPEWLK